MNTVKILLIIALLQISVFYSFGQPSKGVTLATEKAEYNDSNKYGYMSVKLEVPFANNTASKTMRINLLRTIVKTIGKDIMYGSDSGIPMYVVSDASRLQDFCTHYGSKAIRMWTKNSDNALAEYRQNVLNDKDMSAKEKKEALEEIPDQCKFEMDLSLTKLTENSRYVVFDYAVYGYAGGAHGGTYGNNYTFNMKTGAEVKTMLRPGVTRAMQLLLKKGLKRYFADNDMPNMTDRELFDAIEVNNRVIPLPEEYNIYPTKEGLQFTYGQYEIACYAVGMPSFVIPYAQVKPFMTQEAKNLIGLK